MSHITVCARFRPLSSKERRDHGDSVSVQSLDSEAFIFKDEKEEDFTFSFDRVFYQGSEQVDVYEFLALPIVQDAVNAINGTIITYGQTGAGKTYSMEGPSILECDQQKKGLLPRVVDGLFQCIKSSDEATKYTIKLSMVEIYMEKVRDLFDLLKDNIQIKESKVHGILLSGVTEVSILDSTEALHSLSRGIANRAVGETQMNMASSRSHCVYIFTVQQEFPKDKRTRTGKLILVDLAGSEKVEKTGAEGKLLDEAKTINKSLSALGNVINALTCSSQGRANHIPYRDSKLTRILQDALGGNSRTALLCCCSPSPSNASESLSTLRFGARAKHIKASPRVSHNDDRYTKKHGTQSPSKDGSCERILNKLTEKLDTEGVNLLEELFILEGIFSCPNSVEDLELTLEDVALRTISLLQEALEELALIVEELKIENKALKFRLAAAERVDTLNKAGGNTSFLHKECNPLKLHDSYLTPNFQHPAPAGNQLLFQSHIVAGRLGFTKLGEVVKLGYLKAMRGGSGCHLKVARVAQSGRNSHIPKVRSPLLGFTSVLDCSLQLNLATRERENQPIASKLELKNGPSLCFQCSSSFS